MPEKNRSIQVSVAERIEPQINKYYLKVSRRYLAVGVVFMLVLLLYIGAVTVFLGDYVTYDNLKYLARDFSAMTLSADTDFSKMVYNGSDNMTLTYFRGGLAICDSDSYVYYDTGGNLLVEDRISYSSPVLAESDKYLMVYDVGGRNYAIYNQLTEIISRETDGDIVAGDVADDGSFIVASRSRETRYVVELYNSAFKKVMGIYKENYILDAALSPDGKLVVICSAVPSDTDFNCEVEICRRGQADPVSITTYQQTMPLDIYTMENGFVLLCDNGLYFFDYNGNIKSGTNFSGMSLKYADISDAAAAVVCSSNALGTKNRIMAFDSASGTVIYDETVNYRVTGVYASVNLKKELLYFTTPDSVVKINPEGGFDTHIPENKIVDVIPTSRGALVCGKSSAYPIFDE